VGIIREAGQRPKGINEILKIARRSGTSKGEDENGTRYSTGRDGRAGYQSVWYSRNVSEDGAIIR
jgi:hypothetical protein